MKKIFDLAFCSLALVAACGMASSAQAQYAELKATFVLKGKAPEPAPITSTGAYCGTLKIVSENLVVNKSNNGIANLVLYPDPKTFDPKKADPSVKEPVVPKPVLDNNQCRFAPHLLVVQSGQELEVKNSDPEGHNANFSFINNDPVNKQIPAKGSMKVKIDKSEPAPIPVTCGSHSWMKAHVLVQDHPFIGVTDENGQLDIKGLPAGKISLKIWQEAGKFKDITVNGKKLPVKRGAFEIELKPGVNDLGKIELDASDFKP
ncbi:MAG: methylamine utilization protein [Aureliella sp.]|jgi:plastocyanin